MRAALDHDLETEREARLLVPDLAVFQRVPALGEERHDRVESPALACHRRGRRCLRQGLEWREELNLPRAWLGQRARQLGAFEETLRARIAAVVEVGVDPVEVEGECDGAPHGDVLEDRPARVEDESVHAGGCAGAKLSLDDAAVLDRRKIVLGRPPLRLVLESDVDGAGPEGLEERALARKVFVADLVEVVAPPLHRQRAAPVVGIALEHEEPAGRDACDDVGAGADRRLERRRLELLRRHGVTREYRHEADYQRQLAVIPALEFEPDLALAETEHARDALEIAAVEGDPFVLEELEGVDDVVGGDRRAVGEAGFRAESETDGGPVRRHVDALGKQAVERERLIEVAREQRLVDVLADAFGPCAAGDEDIEAVEGAERAEAQTAALRCLRIDVGEVGETWGERRQAVHGDAVGGARAGSGERHQHENKRDAARSSHALLVSQFLPPGGSASACRRR